MSTQTTTTVRTNSDGTVTVTTTTLTTEANPVGDTQGGTPQSGTLPVGGLTVEQAAAIQALRGVVTMQPAWATANALGGTEIEEGPLCIRRAPEAGQALGAEIGGVLAELVKTVDNQVDPTRMTEHWFVKAPAFFEALDLNLIKEDETPASPMPLSTFSERMVNLRQQGEDLLYARVDVLYRSIPAVGEVSLPAGNVSRLYNLKQPSQNGEKVTGRLLRSEGANGGGRVEYWYLSREYKPPRYNKLRSVHIEARPANETPATFDDFRTNAVDDLDEGVPTDARLVVVTVNWTLVP